MACVGAVTSGLWFFSGIEPTGNMVKKKAEFTVETISAGQGEVLVYVEDPAGHREEVHTMGTMLGGYRWENCSIADSASLVSAYHSIFLPG